MRRVVVGLVVATAVCTVAGLAILAISFGLPVPDSWGFRGFPAIFAVTFTWVGAAVVWRRSRNAIGWVLLSVGVVAATQVLLAEYAIFGTVGRPSPIAGAVFAAWLVSWIWVVEVTLVAVFLLLLFPDGHFLSPRWRGLAWLGGTSAAMAVFGLAFKAGPLNNAPYAQNPYPLFEDVYAGVFLWAMAGVAIASIGAAASLFLRYRRSRGTERQQLKWLAAEAIAISIALIVGTSVQDNKWASVFLISAIALAPVMIGIAVLRYRLYDIDVLINRALVYGVTTGAIGVAFFAGIVVLQAALRPVTGGSELAVAASTLVCFALFQPVRRRVQSGVDRRFYRSRYDASRTLDLFTSRLAGEVDLDAVGAELAKAVTQTVRPAHVSLWLRNPETSESVLLRDAPR
jgi:hypothetical protein